MDDTIKEGINDALVFQQVKKKLFKAFPSMADDFKGYKGARRLYEKWNWLFSAAFLNEFAAFFRHFFNDFAANFHHLFQD